MLEHIHEIKKRIKRSKRFIWYIDLLFANTYINWCLILGRICAARRCSSGHEQRRFGARRRLSQKATHRRQRIGQWPRGVLRRLTTKHRDLIILSYILFMSWISCFILFSTTFIYLLIDYYCYYYYYFLLFFLVIICVYITL